MMIFALFMALIVWLVFFSLFFGKKISISEVVTYTLVCLLAQTYASGLVAGTAIQSFKPQTISIISLIFSALVIFPMIRKLKKSYFNFLWKTIKEISLSFRKTVFSTNLNVFLFILVLIILIRTIVYSSILTPFDWDGLDYHLPAIFKIIQHSKIVDHSELRLYAACIFPFAQEILIGYLILAFGNISVGMFLPIIYWLVIALAIYQIFVTLSLNRQLSSLGALIISFIPILITQLNSYYVDISFSTLYLVALLAVIKIFKNCRHLYFYSAIIGLCSGLLLSTKYTAVFVLPAIVIIYIISLVRHRISKDKVLKSLFIIFIITVLLAGYWYIKNYYYYKNPLAPYNISAFGITIFPQYNFNNDIGIETNIPKENQPAAIYSASWPAKIIAVWSEALLVDYTYDVREGGFGVIWWALLIPSIIIAPFFIKIFKDKEKFQAYLLLMCSALVPFLLFGYSRWWSRYVLFIVPFGIYSFLIILNYSTGLFRKLYIFLLSLLAIFIVLVTSSQSYWSIQTLQNLALNKNESASGLLYGNIWNFLQNSQNKTIVYGEYHVFLGALFGKDISNQVYYFQAEDCQLFLKQVREVKADWYLSVDARHKRNYMNRLDNPQKECLMQNDMLGNIVYEENSGMIIYEIKK